MNTLPAVVSALLSVLSVDLGGGFVLTDADQVQEGTFLDPPVWPFIGITPPALQESVPQGVGPDWYRESYSTEIRLWAAVADGTTETRASAARSFATRVQQALDTAKVGGNTTLFRTWAWAVRQIPAEPAGATASPGGAHARLRLDFTILRRSGTGA